MNGVLLVETKLQRLIGTTLRTGVMAASVTGIVGGSIFLAAHGGQPVSFRTFEGTASPYTSPGQMLHQALTWHSADHASQGLAITQLGILLLMLTPIIRVVFSIIGFSMERDLIYVAITSTVLAILIGSLLLR
jgi:uncharacterized membrane protein